MALSDRPDQDTTISSAGDVRPAQQRAASSSGRRYASWIVTLFVVLGSLGVGAVVFWPAPSPVMPTDLDRLDAELVALIRQRADAVRTRPRAPAAHGRLGMVYEANSMFQEARQSYANAVKLADRAPLWHYRLVIVTRQAGDFDNALAMLRDLAVKYPKFAPVQHRLGFTLLEAGQLDEAQTAMEAAASLAPAAAEPLAGLADVKLRQADYQAAAEMLERALKIDPDYKAAHYSLGLAYRGLDRLDEAARELHRGKNGRPRYLGDKLSKELGKFAVHPTGRIDRAEQLVADGKAAEAVALLEHGLTTRPDDLSLTNQLAKTYMGMSRHEQALQLLLRAQRLDDYSISTYVNLTECCLAMKRHEDALRYADRAMELGPTSVYAYLARASVLRDMGRYAEALTSLQAAARLEPHAANIQTFLGDIHFKEQQFAEAKKHFQAAAQLAPELFSSQMNLCVVYIKLEQPEEAELALAEARQIDPWHPRLVNMQRKLAKLQASEKDDNEENTATP